MVYIMLADGFEEIEALCVVDLLRRAEIETKTVSIHKKQVTGSHGICVTADSLFSEIKESEAEAIVLPGGQPGTTHLDNYKPLSSLLLRAHKQEICLCAICAAPSILGHLGILNGYNVTCYPGYETQLEGGILSAGRAVSCGHIVTSRGAGTAIEFALAIIAKLRSRELAEKIGESIQFNKG